MERSYNDPYTDAPWRLARARSAQERRQAGPGEDEVPVEEDIRPSTASAG